MARFLCLSADMIFSCPVEVRLDQRPMIASMRRQENLSPARQASRSARAISIFRSEEHTSELQSLMRISYAVFCLKKKKYKKIKKQRHSGRAASRFKNGLTTILHNKRSI